MKRLLEKVCFVAAMMTNMLEMVSQMICAPAVMFLFMEVVFKVSEVLWNMDMTYMMNHLMLVVGSQFINRLLWMSKLSQVCTSLCPTTKSLQKLNLPR